MNLDKLSKKPLLTIIGVFIVLFTSIIVLNSFFYQHGFAFLISDDFAINKDSIALNYLISLSCGVCFSYFIYKITQNFFGIKEGIIASIASVSSVGMLASFYFNSFLLLYVLLLTISLGITGLFYIKEALRIKFQVPLFYIGLGGAFLIYPVLTILISLNVWFLIYITEKKDLYKFRPLKSYFSLLLILPILLFIFYIYSDFSNLTSILKNISWYEDENFIGFYTLSVFLFFLPFSFFVLPSIPFLKAVKDNIEFKFFKIWFFAVLAVIELYPQKSYVLLGLLIPPLAISIACSLANMALDFRKNFKTNIAIITFFSLFLSFSLILIGLTSINNSISQSSIIVIFTSSFVLLNTMFLGGYAIIKNNFHKSLNIFFMGYSIVAIIILGMLF